MTDAELLTELAKHEALIVHCSRPGKGDEGIGGLLFPDDLKKAIDICAHHSKELCCSVIWPGHTEAFGAVGIILKPRATRSITSICTIDGGTYLDPATGKRVGKGVPLSSVAVMDTFAKATSYNEWNVQDADAIGIFVHPTEPLEVAKRIPFAGVQGYDPAMEYLIDNQDVVGPVRIDQAQIAKHFPTLPIYTFSATGILRLDSNERTPIKAADLYR